MSYQVIVRRSAGKVLARISRGDRQRISAALLALRNDPRPPGTVRLKGIDQWRIRVGDYRVIYEIRDHVLLVTIIKIGHRSQVYRR